MLLSDVSIKNLVSCEGMIAPFNKDNLSPNSYDLTLSDENGEVTIRPGESRLVVTNEVIELPRDVSAKTVSKSTYARHGASIGDVGGWVDAGYKGNLNLLAVNYGTENLTLKPYDKICQIIFIKTNDYPSQTYNGHYQNTTGYDEGSLDYTRK